MKPVLELSRKLKQVVTALCLGSMIFSNSDALAQSIQSIPLTLTLTLAQQGSRINPVDAGEAEQAKTAQDTYFTYDAHGNILTKMVNGKRTTYTYNTLNQLIQIQKPNDEIINLANDYNASGNMRHDPLGNRYQYNLLDQLIQFQNPHTGVKADYQYYANGLRSKKAITSNPMVEPIDYYYDDLDNANIVNEKQGQLTTSYVLPNGHMVRYVHGWEGKTQKQIAIHGSKDVEAILNGQGKIQKTYHYSPNGVTKPINPQDQIAKITHPETTDFSINQNPFQYSGQYHDPESGLDYLRARYYNSQIQRFIERDSYQLLNRYAYVNDNPIMGMDPSGHISTLGWVGIVIGAAIVTGLTVGGGVYLAMRKSEQNAAQEIMKNDEMTEATHSGSQNNTLNQPASVDNPVDHDFRQEDTNSPVIQNTSHLNGMDEEKGNANLSDLIVVGPDTKTKPNGNRPSTYAYQSPDTHTSKTITVQLLDEGMHFNRNEKKTTLRIPLDLSSNDVHGIRAEVPGQVNGRAEITMNYHGTQKQSMKVTFNGVFENNRPITGYYNIIKRQYGDQTFEIHGAWVNGKGINNTYTDYNSYGDQTGVYIPERDNSTDLT